MNMIDAGVISEAPHVANLISGTVPAINGEEIRDRARGVMLGLAAGNLLGLPVEGARSDVISMRYPDGLRDIDPGEADRPMDDDLAQAVDLGEALLTGDDYVAEFVERLIIWARANGRGMGITTGEVISQLERRLPLPQAAMLVYERRNGIAPNGGVMRCAPVAIARRRNPDGLVRDSAATCAVTHYALTCQWSCIIVNAIIAHLLNGQGPDLRALLAAAVADGCPDLGEIAHRDGIPTAVFDAIGSGEPLPVGTDWLRRDHGLIGHTLLALEFGLWAAATPLDLEEGLIASVAAGGDTDTNAAVAGAVLGARFGASSIPPGWLACIPERQRIESVADELAALADG